MLPFQEQPSCTCCYTVPPEPSIPSSLQKDQHKALHGGDGAAETQHLRSPHGSGPAAFLRPSHYLFSSGTLDGCQLLSFKGRDTCEQLLWQIQQTQALTCSLRSKRTIKKQWLTVKWNLSDICTAQVFVCKEFYCSVISYFISYFIWASISRCFSSTCLIINRV